MATQRGRAHHRPFARGGAWLLLGFALASTGAACGETDDAARPSAAGKAGSGGAGPGGGRAGNAGKTGASGTGGATSGRGGEGTAGQGAAGTPPVAGRGGGNSSGRGGNADRGGSAGAGRSSAGESNNAGETSGAGAPGGSDTRCSEPSLVWRSANKTNYTSYPDPGSEECIKYNGCTWAGEFAACNGKKPESWVAAHDIVAAFPDFDSLELHDLCLRKGDKVLVVTVLDTCGDSDCSGCCTENQGSADQLIDIESYTNARWNVPDGPIEWADLGPTTGNGCD